jgi:hypothetical protein
MVVGAPSNDDAGSNQGKVRVYEYSGGSWSQLGGDILDGDANDDQSGHVVRISEDGTIVAISTPYNDNAGASAGKVAIYRYSGGSWSQVGSDINGLASDESGTGLSLSADGSIVAIGSLRHSGERGNVRVYQNDGSDNWVQLGSDLDGIDTFDYFGGYENVDLSDDGTILAVGAMAADPSGISGAGEVRVFQYSGGSWGQLGSNINGTSPSGQFGQLSISADGTILAIGAYNGDNASDVDTGYVQVYQYSGGSWSQIGSDIYGEDEDERFGGYKSL